jgi:hypothetical protein
LGCCFSSYGCEFCYSIFFGSMFSSSRSASWFMIFCSIFTSSVYFISCVGISLFCFPICLGCSFSPFAFQSALDIRSLLLLSDLSKLFSPSGFSIFSTVLLPSFDFPIYPPTSSFYHTWFNIFLDRQTLLLLTLPSPL